ncbi:hypothetical protein [Roseovarius litorisediminis]|uniref:hypothetical protein n=1 Tax=Roseovarius litorisediminis TaxID=1312363 RepID=UPI000A267048|nr:hypothetical protein [Roseovarius litorisediminis]
MAIEAILRKAMVGDLPETGARPATRALELSDYDNLFQGRRIFTGWRRPLPQYAPLYRRVLGDVFDRLPTARARCARNGDADATKRGRTMGSAIRRLNL